MPRSRESYREAALRGWAARREAQERRSEASRMGWETRWEKGNHVGEKGKDFLTEKYRGRGWEDWTEAPIFDEEWEIDY